MPDWQTARKPTAESRGPVSRAAGFAALSPRQRPGDEFLARFFCCDLNDLSAVAAASAALARALARLLLQVRQEPAGAGKYFRS